MQLPRGRAASATNWLHACSPPHNGSNTLLAAAGGTPDCVITWWPPQGTASGHSIVVGCGGGRVPQRSSAVSQPLELLAVFSPENCLRWVHWVRLVGVEENRLPVTSSDVVLPTPHDFSGTFQVGCSARFTASRRVREQEGLCTLKHSLERTLVGARTCH